MIQYQWANWALAFIEGFALILSPCILPILPILFAGSVTAGKRRFIGIIIGFVVVFSLVTSFARLFVQYVALDPDILRLIGFVVILFFGLIMVFDKLNFWFGRFSQRISALTEEIPDPRETGLWPGIILGAAVSLIWVPCGGPILAAAIVQAAVQDTYFESFLIVGFFALGSIIPLLIVAFLGKIFIKQIHFLKIHSIAIRKIMGVVIIAGAFLAFYGNWLPGYLPMPNAPNVVMENTEKHEGLIAGLRQPYAAPPLLGIQGWINSAPLNLEELRGKVVLLDFWTYSCINCVRTLPELNEWYRRFHDQGLEIIGVHTPEFEFEKDFENVKDAIARYHIHYPVALDNKYGTWISYHNRYWPSQYLIDKNGMVVYQKFGEGNAEIMEHNIVTLLNKDDLYLIDKPVPKMNQYDVLQTPEIYLGYLRVNGYGGIMSLVPNSMKKYKTPVVLAKDAWAVSGLWEQKSEKIIGGRGKPSIRLHFFAGKVFAVMGSENERNISVKVSLNGQPIGSQGGEDVTDSEVTVSEHRLYALADLAQADVGQITLEAQRSGLAIYTFTFGN